MFKNHFFKQFSFFILADWIKKIVCERFSTSTIFSNQFSFFSFFIFRSQDFSEMILQNGDFPFKTQHFHFFVFFIFRFVGRKKIVKKLFGIKQFFIFHFRGPNKKITRNQKNCLKSTTIFSINNFSFFQPLRFKKKRKL